jgi:antitoxin MazE
MHSAIRNIGNSKGIILPKNFLVQCDIENEVSIEVKGNCIVIGAVKPALKKREGWGKAFKEMAHNGDDELAIPDVFEDDDTTDWEWK